MKTYLYKRISSKGLYDFKHTNEEEINNHPESQLNLIYTSLKRSNPEGYDFVKNQTEDEKTDNPLLDYLNYYGAQGWKVISVNDENYLMIKEVEDSSAEE